MNDKRQGLNDALKFTSLGFQMLGIIIVGVLLARFIASKLDEKSASLVTALTILLFVIVSIVYGIRQVIKK